MVGIYKIENLITNQCYYGSSKHIEKRWRQHLNKLRLNKHENTLLQRSWLKYGENNFKFEIVLECSTKELLKKEQFFLDQSPHYNIGLKASGGDNISKHPNRKEIINKIKKSNIKRNKSYTAEQKREKFAKNGEKNPNWKGGVSLKKCTICKKNKIKKFANTCQNCRDINGVNNPFFGKSHSEETKQKIRQFQLKNKTKPKNSRKIYADGIIFESGGEAAKYFNITRGAVGFRCKNPKYNWNWV